MRFTTLLPAMILAVGLAACSTPSAPGGNGTGEMAPAAEPAATGPSSLFSVGCDQLVPLDDVTAVLGDAVKAAAFDESVGGTWPLAHVGLQNQGALRCAWNDSEDPQGDYPARLEVIAFPGAATTWGVWAESMGSWLGEGTIADESFGGCRGSASAQYCNFNALVNGAWVHTYINKIADEEVARGIAATITDSLAQADILEAEWTPPESSVTLPADCESLISTAELNAALEVDGIAPRDMPLLMPFIYNAGLDVALACSWSNSYSSSEAMPIDVTIVPGSAWAWEGLWAMERPATWPVESLSGLGDAAYGGCSGGEYSSCFVDVLAGDTWISVTGNRFTGLDHLSALASQVLENVGFAPAP